MEFRERRFVISNRLGLHARAAVQLVKTANQFRSDIRGAVNGRHVNGKSVMGLLTLAASQGASLVVTCEGEDAGLAMEAVAAIIEAGFGENGCSCTAHQGRRTSVGRDRSRPPA